MRILNEYILKLEIAIVTMRLMPVLGLGLSKVRRLYHTKPHDP